MPELYVLPPPPTEKQLQRQVRETFLEAFDRLGGIEYLVTFAQADPANARVFVQALTKMIPKEMDVHSAALLAANQQRRMTFDVPWLTSRRLTYKDARDQTDSMVVEDAVIHSPE